MSYYEVPGLSRSSAVGGMASTTNIGQQGSWRAHLPINCQNIFRYSGVSIVSSKMHGKKGKKEPKTTEKDTRPNPASAAAAVTATVNDASVSWAAGALIEAGPRGRITANDAWCVSPSAPRDAHPQAT